MHDAVVVRAQSRPRACIAPCLRRSEHRRPGCRTIRSAGAVSRSAAGGAKPVHTPICDRLGIEFPIFAFSHCRDVVAAVSRAGGFGVLGALAFNPEELEIELSWIDEHVDGKPYGVDIVMPMAYVGKGGGDEAKLDNLESMIPQQHRDFTEQLLSQYGVPP